MCVCVDVCMCIRAYVYMCIHLGARVYIGTCVCVQNTWVQACPCHYTYLCVACFLIRLKCNDANFRTFVREGMLYRTRADFTDPAERYAVWSYVERCAVWSYVERCAVWSYVERCAVWSLQRGVQCGVM